MVQRQQNVAEPLPPFYLKTLVSLEESLNAAIAKEKEAKKKMNASNAKALTAMKQKVKKISKEYEQELKRFQEVRALAPACVALCGLVGRADRGFDFTYTCGRTRRRLSASTRPRSPRRPSPRLPG